MSMEVHITPEVIEQMKTLAENIAETTEELENTVSSLLSVYEENQDGLGAHSDSILDLLFDLKRIANEAYAPCAKLSLKLVKAAMIRQKHLEDNVYAGVGGGSREIESFVTDATGLKETMSLGKGDSGTKQLAGPHEQTRKEDGPGYESHHIPSAAVLKQFGIDTDKWPTIALTAEDHAKTDSYRGKQQKKTKSIFPDAPAGGTYKEEATELLERGGGFFELVRDEIYNIREQCGDKYDGAIAKFLDEMVEYVKKHGVPKKK